jgi:hypothetical protein
MTTPTKFLRYDTHLAHFLDAGNPRAPGIHIVEPPLDDPLAKRGNIYILVELMGESPVRTQALRQLQATIQETYYTATGSVSAILHKAISSAHEKLHDLNQRSTNTDLRAGIICAALVGGHLIMASAGPSLALLSTEKRLDQFPPGPRHYTGPLGGETPPQISFYRHQIENGDVLFIGESDWILISSVKVLGGAVTTANPDNRFDVVEYLRQQTNQADILGLLLIFEADTTPTSTEPARRRTSTSDLPTAVGAAPPIHDFPSADENVPPVWEQSEQSSTPAPGPATRARKEQTQAGNSAVRRISPDQIETIAPGEFRRSNRTGSQSTRGQSAGGQSAGGQSAGEQPTIGQRLIGIAGLISRRTKETGSQIREFARNILPDRDAPPQDPPEWVGTPPTLEEEEDIEESKPARTFTPPERTRGGKARLFVLLGLLIPLLAFTTVGAVYLQQGASNQADGIKLVELAENQLSKAQQALAVDDKSAARTHLGDAQRYLDEAVALIGFNERIRTLDGQIQTELQDLLQVRSLYSLDFPLVQFPSDAEPHRVVVFDQDIFVLDTGRQVVEFFRTDPTRTVIQENYGIILREGNVVEGVTVGRIIDIAWQPRIPGFADKASLLILDRNNNIFRYNQVDEATYLRLASAEMLKGVSHVESYGGRLYVADERENQIWRFSPAGLGYDQPPEPWFSAQVQSNLAGIVSTAIDGDIWMLMDDGTVLRYRQGQQLPFSLENSPGLTGRVVDMAVGTAVEGRIYLADGSQDRILVFDKQGNYVEQLQAAERNAMRGLRGLYIDNVTGTLFILTQTSLYTQSLPR